MICKKVAFETLEDAKKRLTEIKLKPDERDYKVLNAYKCKKCGKSHLTSMTKALYKAKKKANDDGIINKKERDIQKEAEYWINKKGWEI